MDRLVARRIVTGRNHLAYAQNETKPEKRTGHLGLVDFAVATTILMYDRQGTGEMYLDPNR